MSVDANSKQRVLITGASGFLGIYLVKSCLEKGLNVRVLVRKTSKIEHLQSLNIELFYGDLKDSGCFSEALMDTNTVIHAATAMTGAWDEYLESTIKGTQQLMEASRMAGVKKFVYISSIAVYDLQSCLVSNSINEETPYASGQISFYDRSKIETEKIIRDFVQKTDMTFIIVRPAPIYGGRDKLFPSRIGLPIGSKRIVVIGNGKNKLPLVYAENLSDAIAAITLKPLIGLKIYNIVDEERVTQIEYLRKIKEIVVPGLNIIYLPYPIAVLFSKFLALGLALIKKQSPIRKAFLIVCSRELAYSTQKIREEIGWKPRINVNDAIVKTMHWHKLQRTPPRDVDLKNIIKNYTLKNKYRVGIIGGGTIAHTHIQILKKMQNVEIAAVCDLNKDAAAKLVKQYGIPSVYTEIGEMVKNETINVIHILTPPQFHKDIAIQAVKSGSHVLLEKPMAMDAHEANEIVEAAKQSKVKVCVDHNHVYDPIMIRARKLIAQGVVGEVISVESWYGFNLGSNLNSRYMTADAKKHWAMTIPGKLYQNLMSHPLSVAADIIGYPEQVFALAVSSGMVKAMNTDELRVMFQAKDKIGSISVSLAVNPRYQTMNIYGTKGTIFLDFLNKTIMQDHTIAMIPKPISRTINNISKAMEILTSTVGNTWKVFTKNFTPFDGMEILVREFYKSIDDDSPVPVSAREGLVGMEVMDKIWNQIKV